MLNPSRRSYREKYKEYLEEQLQNYNIEKDIEEIKQRPTYHNLEQIDKVIIRILGKV